MPGVRRPPRSDDGPNAAQIRTSQEQARAGLAHLHAIWRGLAATGDVVERARVAFDDSVTRLKRKT